jgi:SAM-dependent methyltransferase
MKRDETEVRQRTARARFLDAAATCLSVLQKSKGARLRVLLARARREFLAPEDDFDRTAGVETRLTVWRKRLPLKPDSTDYEAVNPVLFARAMSYVPRVRFIDLGCGKGRALILGHQYGFRDLIGVEMSVRLAKSAAANLKKLGIPARIVQSDAAAFDFPEGPLVVFMYNPFGAPTMQEVADKLARRIEPVYVIYVNPMHGGLFRAFQRVYVDRLVMVISLNTQAGLPIGDSTGLSVPTQP